MRHDQRGRVVLLALGFTLLAGRVPAQQPELVASTEAKTPDQEKAAFHLPPGFEAQLVASEPAIHKPMNLAFDARGRLWVTSSLEYPFPKTNGEKGRDAVVVLDDIGDDGRAKRVSTFVDGLNIPIGILPLSPTEAIVHSIPKIRRFLDTDGDGKADKEEDAYSSIGFADTHGMANHFTRGFDGWIYACHGFANNSKVAGADKNAVTMNSGNTFRMKPDGSHVEQWTWGQVNPFGLAFDSIGNIFTCDCHSRPIYQVLRGAYYPSFGKPDDGLGFGPEMMTHDHGSTGIGGLAVYAADGFPENYRDGLFIGNVVTSRINWDKTDRHGSTLLGVQQPDFLVSDDPWFRPVDIVLGPDGALYVADFYNKIIGHYEVPLTHPGRDRERGRIWRIVYKGADAKATPAKRDILAATDGEVLWEMGHPNLAVRMRATDRIVERIASQADSPDAKELIRVFNHYADSDRRHANTFQQIHALWALERTVGVSDERLVKLAENWYFGVRTHVMKALAERPTRSESARPLALAGLKDKDAFVRRAAAEALGQHPSPEFLRPLLDARQAVPGDDTHLLHAVRMALRDQLRSGEGYKALGAIPLSDRDRVDLADVSLGVPTADSARFLVAMLKDGKLPADLAARAVHHSARFGDPETTASLIAFAKADRADDLGHQAELLKAVHQGTEERGAALGDDASVWAESLMGRVIASKEDAQAISGIELASSLKLASARGGLERLAKDASAPESRRLAAIDAIAAIGPAPIGLLGDLLGSSEASPAVREKAATLLARINQGESIDRLLAILPIAPGRLQSTIALGLAGRRPGADRLLDLVASGKASARLLQERPVQVQLNQAGIPDLSGRMAALLKDLPPAEQAIEAQIRSRRVAWNTAKGDASAGALMFAKHCAGCHQIAGQGARVGPQLDGIGVRGPDRLLEDILDPNRNVDQAFRTTQIGTKDGQVLAGLLLREDGSILVIADNKGKEIRIPSDSVEERKIAQISPMPANLAEQIPEKDFFDLLSYLLKQDERRGGK